MSSKTLCASLRILILTITSKIIKWPQQAMAGVNGRPIATLTLKVPCETRKGTSEGVLKAKSGWWRGAGE